jgi:3-hydroxybutyryl-CoA dehydratase
MSEQTDHARRNGPGGPADLEVGSEIASRSRTISESDLMMFSALTGDWHPQHADAVWAAESRFGERIAHGMLVLSYSLGLAQLDPNRVVALRGFGRVAFKRPVHMGDTIRVVAKVAELKPIDPEHSLAALDWRVLNQRDEVAVRARLEAVVRSSGTPSMNGAAEAPAASSAGSAGDEGAADELGDLYGERVLL